MMDGLGTRRRWSRPLWVGWTAVLTLLFLAVAADNLAHFRPVSSDDVWITSASHKLATTGVFGSDMFAGFFNADQVYFIALPGQHLLQAAIFRLVGADLFTARLSALFSAVLLIWLVGGLAYRWFGGLAAVLASGLLVHWPADLIASGRPSLLYTGQTSRYDLLGATLVWLAIYLIERQQERPSLYTAFLLGAAAAAAALTQFFGLFVLPLIGLAWLSWRGRPRRLATAYALLSGFLLLAAPYALYSFAHWPDFTGQATLKQERVAFADPAFYLNNLRREPNRYLWLAERPSPRPGDPLGRPFSPWLLVGGTGPALLYLGFRARGANAGARRLGSSLLILVAGLALFDQTKAPLYSIVLWPALCLAFALPLAALLQRAVAARRGAAPWLGLATLAVLAIIAYEGVAAFRQHRAQARTAVPYATSGARLAGAIPPNTVVLGAERWWWALRDRPYLSLTTFWQKWRLAGPDASFANLVRAANAGAIVVNDNIRGDLRFQPEPLQAQFWRFLADCSTVLDHWSDPTYGRIALHQLDPPDPAGQTCHE